jgi:hypothetical protein
MDFEVTRTDIELAASRIAPHIRRTPVLDWAMFSPTTIR